MLKGKKYRLYNSSSKSNNRGGKMVHNMGFRLSVSKSNCMFFSRKNIKLYLYGNPLERVSVYKYSIYITQHGGKL